MEPTFRGEYGGPTKKNTIGAPSGLIQTQIGDALEGEPQEEEQNPFAGMGPILEDDDETVFKQVDGLVQRQELIALNHLAQDTHWTYVKLGYPWSELKKSPNKDLYVQSMPYGSAAIQIQAVPNKSWDLINKTTEALLVDFPQVECEPGTDSEEAQGACEMADRFLTQDASERGTNDAVLWNDRVARAMTCASSYIECWTDPTGGGYVPLQIPAHPQAESPMNPLIGPEGMPTPSPILRYVTSIGPDGQPTEESQFTDDATKAAPQWQPKLRAQKWQREHIRKYPETATVDEAEKVIILGYCTLSEAKRRWPMVSEMPPEDLDKLCDWTPQRYLALLPMFLRGRWKLTDGRDKEKQGSSDERIMFYYHPYIKACPDYTKGADVVVSGAFGGKVLDRKLLSKEVEVPVKAAEDEQTPGGSKKETRCMEIPVVQVRPRGDPDEMDPDGKPYIELFAGAVENNAHLALSASEVIDKNLHLEGYSSSTSPISGSMREDARASGDLLNIIRPEDMPKWGEPIPFEQAFFNFFDRSEEAINSIGSANKAAKGQENADEKSGKAIQLATANNNVSLGGMNHAINNSYARWNRIKIERFMCDFPVSQQISYVGDDGIFKQENLSATDFALIGKVTIKAGTGGLLTEDQKVQNIGGLVQVGMMTPEEGKDAARPAFSKRLGLPADPHEQRIERQITAFNKGMPSPEWAQMWQQYEQEKQAYDGQQMQAQQTAQQDALNAPAKQAQEQERMKHEQTTQMETQKAQTAMEMEREKHRMALEAKQVDAEHAERAAANTPQPAAPQTPPEIVVQPPDLAPIADAISEIRNLVAAVISKEPTPQERQEPPVIHVHPAAAPNVQVSPQVHVPPQAEKKRGKRSGKITGPKGETHTFEVGEDD